MKDYYAILGISVKAEEEVIIAAYKALVKKYHPDVYKGSKKEADARIRDINEAYETLSNKTKKEKYDKDFFQNDNAGNFEDFEKSDFKEQNIYDDDWNTLIEVFPEAEILRQELTKISSKIGLIFQVTLLTKKLGNKSKIIAEEIKIDFLNRYFGKNKKIHEIALKAILNKEVKLARELNKKIKLLGDGASEKIYIDLKDRINRAVFERQEKEKAKKREEAKRKQKEKYKSGSNNNNKHKEYSIPSGQKFFGVVGLCLLGFSLLIISIALSL